jgi:HEPN domain-containing protein
VRQEALDWLEEAQVDLRRARRSLEDGDYALSCFESHQAAEKAMKAVVIGVKRRRAPRTHDLTILAMELEDIVFDVGADDLPDLSQYYVTSHYHNAGIQRHYQSFTQGQAVRAHNVAERVVTNAARLLAEEGD